MFSVRVLRGVGAWGSVQSECGGEVSIAFRAKLNTPASGKIFMEVHDAAL